MLKQRHSVLNFWWPLNSGNGKDKDDPKVAMGCLIEVAV